MEPSSPTPSPSAEADAGSAWAFACGLGDDASPPRVDAVVNVLVNLWNADCARMTAAAAVCRARERANGDEIGWREAADFLDRAIAKIRDAGADTAGAAREQFVDGLRAEMFPDPQPFRWPTHRRRRPQWWLRRHWLHVRLRLVPQPPSSPARQQLLRLHIGRVCVGKLDFQVCDLCRRGFIRKIDVDSACQGFGLGERAVRAAHRQGPGYDWRTTVQYPTAGTFWTKMAERTGSSLREDANGACPHMAYH
jgi:hypothetical protein